MFPEVSSVEVARDGRGAPEAGSRSGLEVDGGWGRPGVEGKVGAHPVTPGGGCEGQLREPWGLEGAAMRRSIEGRGFCTHFQPAARRPGPEEGALRPIASCRVLAASWEVRCRGKLSASGFRNKHRGNVGEAGHWDWVSCGRLGGGCPF